ncbi:MAG: SDR family oxidoreductase [Kribbellaceae bacterium]
MLDKQTVLVIGGSSGIGHEVARQVAEQGAAVRITGRDERRLAAAAERLGAQATRLDAHDERALEAFFADLDEVDHLVSMVGDSMAGGFLDTPADTMRHVLHSKFFTNWTIGRLAAPKLRDGGSLTFTTGTGGRAQDISATYVANLGIGALVEGLAAELAPRVRVNAVAPTIMKTGFWKDMPPAELEAASAGFSQSVPLRRHATVEEVASAYVHLMGNGFITGQNLAVDGGVMLTR